MTSPEAEHEATYDRALLELIHKAGERGCIRLLTDEGTLEFTAILLADRAEAVRAERERWDEIVNIVRLIGKASNWDAPMWNLHVPRKYAEALFDAAYDHESEFRQQAREKKESAHE